MRYVYDLMSDDRVLETTTDVREVTSEEWLMDGVVRITDNITKEEQMIFTMDALEAHIAASERSFQWVNKEERLSDWSEEHADAIKSAVDPDHYKGFVGDSQWLEVMQDVIPDIDSAVLMQVYKYLARNGKKDDSRQELLKALFYLKFLTARTVAGRNIDIAEVDTLLKEV